MRPSILLPVLCASVLIAMQFEANTRLIQINVIVRDKNGPVANLTKDDFIVADRGKPRSIAVFSKNVSVPSHSRANRCPRTRFQIAYRAPRPRPT
jgi:hypothetical protein